MYGGAARRYMQVSLQTASAGQLLLALYDAAIRDARGAAEHIRARNVLAKAKDIQRASAIVAELASTLDHRAAPELCQNLERLYFYMQDRLTHANAMMQPEPAEEVAHLLELLREAWGQAVAQVESGQTAMPRAASAAS